MSDQDMEELLKLVEAHLGQQWIEVTDWLREHNQLEDIEARLRAHDYEGVIHGVEDAAMRYAAETHAAFVLAAQRTAAWLDGEVDSLVRFDLQNTHAVEAARANQWEWATGWSQESREVVQQIIVRGREDGANPLELAQQIRDSIGLTPQQEAAVNSYRQALRDADWSNALGRELSSGQSDRSVAAARSRIAAIRADRSLTQDEKDAAIARAMPTERQIDTAVSRYSDNMHTARAETIARTESLRAIHQGQQAAFDQAVDRGDVDADTLVHEWHHALVGRYSRPDHVDMDGTRVKYGEDFTFPDGVSMSYPGDPRGGAKHNANCRCTRSTTIDGVRKALRRAIKAFSPELELKLAPVLSLTEHLARVRVELEVPELRLAA